MFWQRKKEGRKERSDKKVHIQPTISVKLKAEIERLARILDQPIKRVGELLFIAGINERDVIERFAPYFQKDALVFENSYYRGRPENRIIDYKTTGPTDRISIRFDKDGYYDVDLFADMLDVSHSKVVALFLDASIRHAAIIEYLLQHHNKRYHFDEVTSDELRKLMKFVNRNNPYKTAWNDALVEVVHGAKMKIKNLSRKATEKSVDRETYKWDLD